MTEEKFVDPTITSDDRLWALLSYLLTPVVPIIILLIEDKKNRPFLKAHYPQALAFGLAWFIVAIITSWTLICPAVLGVTVFVFQIIWGIKANNGEYVTIPLITDFVKKQGWAD